MILRPQSVARRGQRVGLGSLSRRLGDASDLLLLRLAHRAALAAADRLLHGQLTLTLPDGTRHIFGDVGAELQAEVCVHDAEALVGVLFGGATGVGEAYVDGLWSSPDLVKVLRLGALNQREAALSAGWWRAPAQLRRTIAHRARRNTPGQARRNIQAHYDLGNDFYRMFLDETLTYSSAVFASPGQTLAEAQRNKYRLIAERAGLRAGDHVLEIGCGWGGFALYAAGELGCRVTAITISEEQRRLASERVRAASLERVVDVQLRDYRQIEGSYDAVVSIEMLEAVGAEYFGTYFRACDRVLAPGGRLSVQVITLPDADYEAQRRGANWIQRHIFPGGLCPSVAALERSLRGTGLLVSQVDDISQHYVQTLRVWRTRFLEQRANVSEMGFDERFMRTWEYYLALSEASFATGMSQDLQIVFEKRR